MSVAFLLAWIWPYDGEVCYRSVRRVWRFNVDPAIVSVAENNKPCAIWRTDIGRLFDAWHIHT